MKTRLTTLLFTLFVFKCYAQQNQQNQTNYVGPCSNCNAIIVQDIILNSSSVYQEIKYYESIDSSTFYELKKEDNAGISVLKLVSASNDYNEFQQNLTNYKKQVNYDIISSSYNQYSSYIHNPIVYASWEKCVSQTCSKADFSAWVKQEDQKSISIFMKYLYKGVGPKSLRIKLDITQNGKNSISYTTINPGSEIPYVIQRVFDNEGKSYISMVIQPIDQRGVALFDGFEGHSAFFAPNLNVKNISVDYIETTRPLLYSKDNLNAPDYEEKGNPVGDKWPIGYASCDRKWLAYPLETTLIADPGCYFDNPEQLAAINFDAISGPGAGWNQGLLRGDCKAKDAVITYSTPSVIKIRFTGSASKATNWSVYRDEIKQSPISKPVIYQYADKNTLNLSVPLSFLKDDFKINIATFDQGTFILDKNSRSTVFNDDQAKGLRYYTINLSALINGNIPANNAIPGANGKKPESNKTAENLIIPIL